MKRREFLQKSGLVVASAVAVVSGVVGVGDADQWNGKLKALNAHEAETLLKMSRQIFPHDQLDDSAYVKVVEDLDAMSAQDPATAKLMRRGVGLIDRATNSKFASLSSDEQVAALKKIEKTPFFGKVRQTEVVSLYDNHEVWKRLGYPGPSFAIGGYLHHGFNDLNWLPDPPESASPKPA